jgi:hypothetical protein
LSSPAQAASPRIASVKVINTDSPVDALLSEFPDLIRPSGVQRDVRLNTVHNIRTPPGPLVTCRPRRLAPHRLKIAKVQFDAMVRDGTARPSGSPWSSALLLVSKKDYGWRPCGDYRALYSRIVPDCSPVRHIHDYTHQISGCRVFTKIDPVRAYNQIPVQPSDIQKTAITTPFGLFEFPFMSFGLRNAAQTLQRFMDEVLRRLEFCFPYPDDILVYSLSLKEHEWHLRILFRRLHTYGVIINSTKCVFRAPEVTFLGYKVPRQPTPHTKFL